MKGGHTAKIYGECRVCFALPFEIIRLIIVANDVYKNILLRNIFYCQLL